MRALLPVGPGPAHASGPQTRSRLRGRSQGARAHMPRMPALLPHPGEGDHPPREGVGPVPGGGVA
eukprot:9734325-Alexandrium_andersonii.AAC.1